MSHSGESRLKLKLEKAERVEEPNWKGDGKQNPLGCHGPVLVRMMRKLGRMTRIFRK